MGLAIDRSVTKSQINQNSLGKRTGENINLHNINDQLNNEKTTIFRLLNESLTYFL